MQRTIRPLLLRQQKNSKLQGDIGLAVAIGWLCGNGYSVAIPLTDSHDYDLVIHDGKRFYSVQVKTTYYRRPETGNYSVNLRVSGGNRSGTGKVKLFNPETVDYVFAVTEEGHLYFIPSKMITARNSLSLCEKYAEYRVDHL
ncbi:MAG: group I intron-associated PD-(D/E)XK endonuclease [bacterium]|nr:group I intron-associated PD-(D/E)XK endonuclease [bacterium]